MLVGVWGRCGLWRNMNFQIHTLLVAANEVAGRARRISSGGRCRPNLGLTMIVQIWEDLAAWLIYHHLDQIPSTPFFSPEMYHVMTLNQWTYCLTQEVLHVLERIFWTPGRLHFVFSHVWVQWGLRRRQLAWRSSCIAYILSMKMVAHIFWNTDLCNVISMWSFPVLGGHQWRTWNWPNWYIPWR